MSMSAMVVWVATCALLVKISDFDCAVTLCVAHLRPFADHLLRSLEVRRVDETASITRA